MSDIEIITNVPKKNKTLNATPFFDSVLDPSYRIKTVWQYDDGSIIVSIRNESVEFKVSYFGALEDLQKEYNNIVLRTTWTRKYAGKTTTARGWKPEILKLI